MENLPLVSILMPVYNGREYLKPAIDSLLAQSFKDFELIVVNDGSKDDSQAIVESYKDPRIVLINQQNQGVARSLNNGLKVAKGKYIRRHDADDISTPDSLQIQVDFMETHPEYVMVCNQQAFMTSNGKIAGKHRVPNNKFFEGQKYKDLTFDDFSVSSSSPVVHGTACYKRQEVIDLGCYRPEFIVSEDNDLWLRLLEKSKIAILNECTYFMRIHGGSATHFHAAKIKHFRHLLIEYSKQRRQNGSDPIMRGEHKVPEKYEEIVMTNPATSAGRFFREDLRYIYSLEVDARDFSLIRKTAWQILKDGWKDSRTYKMLLFPLLGPGLTETGVKVKKALKR
jgi:glycosyltransferase involved in cell wall biosynthesis